jgi:hypothetical protein
MIRDQPLEECPAIIDVLCHKVRWDKIEFPRECLEAASRPTPEHDELYKLVVDGVLPEFRRHLLRDEGQATNTSHKSRQARFEVL